MIDCYDIVQTAIEDASNGVFKGVRKRKDAMRFMRTFCTAVNTLSERLNSSSLNVEINMSTGAITVTMNCPYVDMSDVFVPARFVFTASLASHVRLSAANGVAISFILPGVWENAI